MPKFFFSPQTTRRKQLHVYTEILETVSNGELQNVKWHKSNMNLFVCFSNEALLSELRQLFSMFFLLPHYRYPSREGKGFQAFLAHPGLFSLWLQPGLPFSQQLLWDHCLSTRQEQSPLSRINFQPDSRDNYPNQDMVTRNPSQGPDTGPVPFLGSLSVSLRTKAEASALVPNIALINWTYWLWVCFIFVPFSIFLVPLFSSHFYTKTLVLILFRCFIKQTWMVIPKWSSVECTWWKFHF